MKPTHIIIDGREFTIRDAYGEYPTVSRNCMEKAAETRPVWSLTDLQQFGREWDAEAERKRKANAQTTESRNGSAFGSNRKIDGQGRR